MGLSVGGSEQTENKGQVAKVISLSEGKATVKIQRHASCEKCGVCNLGIVNSTEKTAEVENTLNVREGDFVALGIKSGAILSASFIVYIIPLLTFFVGLLIGNNWAHEFGMSPDHLSIILGTAFLVLTFVIINFYDRRVRKKTNKFTPYIIRIIGEDEAKDLVGEKECEENTEY